MHPEERMFNEREANTTTLDSDMRMPFLFNIIRCCYVIFDSWLEEINRVGFEFYQKDIVAILEQKFLPGLKE